MEKEINLNKETKDFKNCIYEKKKSSLPNMLLIS